jgi:chorismate--pyruvate lyase
MAHWFTLGQTAARAPHELLPWLSEPGLLTARLRALCGLGLEFRMLGPLRDDELRDALRARMGVDDTRCLVREVEFGCAGQRVVFAQTVLPASTVERFPWLSELGDAPLGEALRRADASLEREPLECALLPTGHPLRWAAVGGSSAEVATGELWARRALYRLDERPMLVQEVFLPGLLRVQNSTRRSSDAGPVT